MKSEGLEQRRHAGGLDVSLHRSSPRGHHAGRRARLAFFSSFHEIVSLIKYNLVSRQGDSYSREPRLIPSLGESRPHYVIKVS